VREAVEAQVLNGTGVSPQIGPGLLVDPAIPTVDYAATPYLMDLILTAVIELMNQGTNAVVTVLNPTDLGTMLGSTNANEDYVSGGPFAAGSLQLSIWGTLAVPSPSVPAGTALVGSPQVGSRLWVREPVQVYVSDSDQDSFVKNMLTFLGETAVAFTNEQPEAWRKVDLSATTARSATTTKTSKS
jgi:Phage capsid family